LGAGGLVFSGPELLASSGLIEETNLIRGLAGAGLGFGAYATLADFILGTHNYLAPLFGC
jgi:hypothetical protein